MMVRDATQDVRFSANPLVLGDPNIRFYAGSPIVTGSGNALGTLCVIDRVPRELTADQERALRALSTQVMALLELRRAVDSLDRQQDELEQLIKQREAFMAAVSHEIRTPLTAVAGFLELVTDEQQLRVDEREELVAAAGRQAREVVSLLDDLLLMVSVESGKLRVAVVELDLAPQIFQALEGVDQSFASGVRVDASPSRVIADPIRLRQILRNLLTNAHRYGGGDVRVSVSQFDDGCLVEVSDDGPGIPDPDIETAFENFRTVPRQTVVAGSIGLGLPISRQLAEMMGGTLRYSRKSGRTVFTLELPSAVEPAPVSVV